jgi:hypothetical protein
MRWGQNWKLCVGAGEIEWNGEVEAASTRGTGRTAASALNYFP